MSSKQNTKQSKMSKEEELLLQDFSRSVSRKSSAFFFINALIVSVIPLWLFWRIHQMDPMDYAILWVIMTLVSTWFICYAYKNRKFVLKHQFARHREDAISREVLKSIPDDRKISKKEKDERILWKKHEVAEYEAISFSIFYNNTLYILMIIFFSFVILQSVATNLNYVLSTASSAGLLALFSTSSK